MINLTFNLYTIYVGDTLIQGFGNLSGLWVNVAVSVAGPVASLRSRARARGLGGEWRTPSRKEGVEITL